MSRRFFNRIHFLPATNVGQTEKFDNLDRNSAVEDLQVQRDEIAQEYFDVLPFEPYPVQEEALFAWFSSDQGVKLFHTPWRWG